VGIVLAIAVLLVGGSAGGAWSSDDEFVCPSATVSTIIDGVVDHRHTLSPEQLADNWKSGQGVYSPSKLAHRTERTSGHRAKISFSDVNGQTAAILNFEKSENGWSLVTMFECGMKHDYVDADPLRGQEAPSVGGAHTIRN
jgi:hypothetical protein